MNHLAACVNLNTNQIQGIWPLASIEEITLSTKPRLTCFVTSVFSQDRRYPDFEVATITVSSLVLCQCRTKRRATGESLLWPNLSVVCSALIQEINPDSSTLSLR